MKTMQRPKLQLFLCCMFLGMFARCNQPPNITGPMDSPDTTLTDRKPAVAGQFYPDDPSELKKVISAYFSGLSSPASAAATAAIISPHAGYIFSGEVAAAAFSQLDSEKEYKNVFLIGCSHRAAFKGGSIYTVGNYITPLGTVEVNLEIARTLATLNKDLSFDPQYQRNEHSTEVQIPFLQVYLKKPFRIIPILLGTHDPYACRSIANSLKPYFTEENVFVISTDFSHYPAYDDAVKVDKRLADAILSNDPEKFIEEEGSCLKKSIPDLATGCCSWPAVLTLMYITETDPSVEYHKIAYKNSGDSKYGEKDRVVGYNALSVTRKPEMGSSFELTSDEKNKLLTIARQTIREYLSAGNVPEIDPAALPGGLVQKAGAFVTLRKNGELRGCIGHFDADNPLYSIVQQMAVASSTRDYRFSRVQPEEMKDIEIEISVLTPMKKIASVKEIRLGRDGIYISKGNRGGTFLPQVATETGWSLEEFLGHCARDKAGIGWDGWKDKDTEIYIYQAYVFSE